MDQRISLVTLGVKDVDKAAAFYEALGWQQVETQDGLAVFDLIGQSLGLYPLQALADDLGIEVAELGAGASTLGCNTRSKEEVAAVLALAKTAGGSVLKDAQDVFWGGHHGFFRDLDGHIWEVAFNPFSTLRDDGAFRWNGF